MTDDFHAKYAGLDHERLYQQLMAGDPDQIDAVAAKISSMRDSLGTLRDTLHTDLAGLAKGWSSDSGTEYQRRLGLIGSFSTALHSDLDSVHTTLTSWSGLLREAKKRAESEANPADTDDNNSTVKDAAIGAAAGAPLGVPGMLAGGLIGGWMGHNQDEEERQKAHDRMITLVATLAANYTTSDRMPETVSIADSEMPVDSTNPLTFGTSTGTTSSPHGVHGTGAAVNTAAPVVDATKTDEVALLSGTGDQVGLTTTGDSLAIGGLPGSTGSGSLLSNGTLAATALGATAAGIGALGATGRLPFGTGGNLASAEATGGSGVGRPGNLFSGTGGRVADEGALGINRGTGAAGARRGADDEDEEHRTWLTEDEMVWGDDQSTAPPVVGGDQES
ncbi:WXG100 family type VII secretion target [Dactylosporangium sp. CS-033363]|uniref:WXG100 family type VII secretion target n=1 Tax=Dactylosporangium sp. CS-033363 TaxID=3239935 RepID=UPI003D91F9F6